MNISELAIYIAPLVGLVTLVIGIAATLFPKPMSKKFGVAAEGPALAFVVATGIRDVFIGLTVFVLFAVNLWPILGAIHLFIGAVALSDFLTVRKNGDKRISLVHLGGAFAVIGYGIWLLITYWP